MTNHPLCLGLAGLLFLAHPLRAQDVYRDLSREGAGFYGPGREQEAPDTLSVVRIGLTGPEKSRAGRHLRRGVALALEEANAAGGYRGLPYQVVFRPDDGPWGAVAQQAVHLAYQDQVWAIILLAFLMGAFGALSRASMLAERVELGKSHGMGSMAGLQTGAFGMGQMLGPLVSGALVDIIGVEAVFPFGAAIGLIGTVLTAKWLRRATQ